MPDGITVKVEGLAELERAMNRLDEKLAKKGAVEAVRAGNRLVKRAVVASFLRTFIQRSGDTVKLIRTRLQIKGRGVQGATVKMFTYLKAHPVKAPSGRFWELGFTHIGRGKRRRALHRRGIAISGAKKLRREWMRPAMEEVAPRVIAAVVAKLRAFLRPGG